MMRLTEHFTLAEMTRSATAIRRGLDNSPGTDVIEALLDLCQHVLEPVRAHFGPVKITSGYRSVAVNRAVGGSAASQHCRGQAADFTVPGHSNIEVCRWMLRHLYYDQLIYEFGEAGWVHVSWCPGPLRNMELTARRQGRRTVYLPGLVP